jgi:Ras-related protein Rab-1A
MLPAPYDEIHRYLFIGDSGIGKTSLLVRYADDEWSEMYGRTVGVDFKIKNIICNGRRIKLQIWDSPSGGGRFPSLTSSYYRGAHAFMMCFDLSDVTTFKSLKFWLQEVEKYSTNPDVPIIIVGTKKDLEEERQVDAVVAREFAESLGHK